MVKTIKTSELDIGMYVIMPSPWYKHTFLKNSFTIACPEDIQRIIDHGIQEIAIDTDKGSPPVHVKPDSLSSDKPRQTIHGQPLPREPKKLISDELKMALGDKKMPKEKRAKTIYQSSLRMMEQLLDDPKAENIQVVKKEIANMVDTILTDNVTAIHMLHIRDHDSYTYTHSVNVGILAIMLSKALFQKTDAHNMHELGAGFFLHDLGKTRVDPAIINKPGKLTEDEMKKMKTHPYESYRILAEADQLTEECRIIAMQHHEREDGRGYPRRLRGDQIHIYGRIGSIADVFDALTSGRSYKPRLSPYGALRIMKEEMIHHFHKDMFEKFVLLLS